MIRHANDRLLSDKAKQRARVVVRGVVQGVGFRPFVYRLATEQGLTGWVLNSTEGVVIEVEGRELERFVARLGEECPPLARIDRIEVTPLPLVGYTSFAIEASVEREGSVALVSPDVSICPDCLREIRDPANRRYRYPFTNCTNCGPRFTIVRDIPYDRPKTTMADFRMCPRCEAEYHDPTDRRFHAQPNACPDCGPRLTLLCQGGEWHGDAALAEARRLLLGGQIVAVKGLGGFHLACDGTAEGVVAELRRRKRRVEKPFAIMVADAAAAEAICEVSVEERRLLESPQRPIVLLKRKANVPLAPSLAPRNPNLGVMLPYTPLHYLLFEGGMPPLVMTSGNLSEEPIAIGNDEARERLGGLADAFLVHNREIHTRCDDSVTRVFAGKETLVRRSRGYAPFPVRLAAAGRHVLGCGAELKNTFCLARDDYAFLSHHIGDLENEETLRSYEEGIAHFERLFRVTPEAIACDLHPDYLSTRYALARAEREGLAPARLIAVQHHHAHVASCLADNGFSGQVIGVAFDGTGYGTDGAIWGGEFLVAGEASYRRHGYLAYVPLPGGDAAIHRPYRTALSHAYAAFGKLEPALSLLRTHSERDSSNGRGERRLGDTELAVLARQVQKGMNSPPTSSIGRLFDAVSALAGVRLEVNYEGQAAIELEMAADPDERGAYPLPLVGDAFSFVLDPAPLVRAVVADVRAAEPVGAISARFHNALAQAVAGACRIIAEAGGPNRVALSGGVFQNRLLLARATEALEAAGMEVLIHHQVPCNDGGIALGQVVVANARLREQCTS